MEVVHVLEATDGGTRTHILHALRGLDRGRFKQTLIASAEREPLFRRDMEALRSEGTRVIEVPMVRRIAPGRDPVALARLVFLLRKERGAIIHTHASKAGALGRIAARLAGCRRVVHTPHVFYFEGRRGAARAFYRRIERALLRFTTRLVLLTEAQRETAVRDLGMPRERTAVIPNGVDTERFRPGADKARARASLGLPPEAPIVGCITRFMPQKGNFVFLDALGKVFRELPAARAVLVGDGPEKARATAAAEKLGLGGRIAWVLRTDRPEDVYSALDVFALASLHEGMPYTVLEAMASGVPVVATAVPGVADVVQDGLSGLLCPPNDPEAMAERIIRLLAAPAERNEMATAARRRAVESFPIKRFLAALAALYESMAQSD
jgi:glycosyltransferase involved in cell wall biosynthesis